MKKNIGFKIRKLRETMPLSQEEMAFELGVSQSTLCKIENGYVEKVDFSLMDKICKLFKVSVQCMLEDSFSPTYHDNMNTSISVRVNSNNLIETILNNQNQITQLLESQNRLIGQLMSNT